MRIGLSVSVIGAATMLVFALPASADQTMTATFDGKPWTASFSQAIEMSIGGKPQLNLSGTEQGSPTMTFNSLLALPSADALAGTYELKKGSGSTANFNVLDGGAVTRRIRFTSGEIVIDSYDPAAKTVSGHFAATGKDEDGKDGIAIENGSFSGIPVNTQ